MSWEGQPVTEARLGHVRHTIAVVWASVCLGVLSITAYRFEFTVGMISVIIRMATQLVALGVVFGTTSKLNGWTAPDVLILVGVHAILGGCLELVVIPSMSSFIMSIRMGTFDFILTKPVDAQVLSLCRSFDLQGLGGIVVGGVVVGLGVARDGSQVTSGGLLLFFAGMACGWVVLSSFLMMLCATAFWLVDVDNVIEVFDTVFGQAGKWPLSTYPRWVQIGLVAVIPVGVAVSVPARALSAGVDMRLVVMGLVSAVIFAVCSRLIWNAAIRSYSGASG